MEKLIRGARDQDEQRERDSIAPALRMRATGRVLREVERLAVEVCEARADEDRARLVEFEQRSKAPSEQARVAHKLVGMRRQVTWGKTAHLAQAVCLLMSESAGGEPMAADEAGVVISEADRALVAYLVEYGRRLRAGGAR